MTTRTTGQVKWFNNKAGYGFVTVTAGEVGDVFVHHSAIQVAQEQYRYLVQGEYIEFVLQEVATDGHKWQATDIRGVNGGKLMCETRTETRSASTSTQQQPRTSQPRTSTQQQPRTSQPRTSQPRTSQPRTSTQQQQRVASTEDGVEWLLVRRKVPTNTRQH
jgi:CspA family cold shock protein